MDLNDALSSLKDGFELMRTAIGAVKDAKELLPAGDNKAALETSVHEAERAVQLAEAQIAQCLGYHLCQCTFPPQIMTSKGYHPRGIEIFECPSCRKQLPNHQHFEHLDRRDAAVAASNERGRHWMGY